MVNVKSFVSTKSNQLCYYLRALWLGDIEYNEIDLFFWDTLEEWSIVTNKLDIPYTQKERVFWHLLHQIHFWTEDKLKYDQFLIDELSNCVRFLEGKGICPFDCVGIRP